MPPAHTDVLMLTGLRAAGKETVCAAFNDYYGATLRPYYLTKFTSREASSHALSPEVTRCMEPGAMRYVPEAELRDPISYFGFVEKNDACYGFSLAEVRQWLSDRDSAVLVGSYNALDPIDDFLAFQAELEYVLEEEFAQAGKDTIPTIHWILVDATLEECAKRLRERGGMDEKKIEREVRCLSASLHAIRSLQTHGRFDGVIENHGTEKLTDEYRVALASRLRSFMEQPSLAERP